MVKKKKTKEKREKVENDSEENKLENNKEDKEIKKAEEKLEDKKEVGSDEVEKPVDESKESKLKDNKEDKEICETFEVEKNEKVETIESCGEDKTEKTKSKDQIANQNKLLKNFLIVIGIISVALITLYFMNDSMKKFAYEEIDFDLTRVGDVLFYHTAFPVYENGAKIGNYNIYLRKDPRKIGEIDFKGEMNLREMMVVNYAEKFQCEGKGVIASGNMNRILNEAFGINVIQDPEAECDAEGRYMFVNVLPGDKTFVEQTGPACYNIYVNECEILEGTEKFILESYVKYRELTGLSSDTV